MNELRKSLKQQYNILKIQILFSYSAMKASYTICQILAKKIKPFVDGERFKECVTVVVKMAFR